jgi:hypothetical protein
MDVGHERYTFVLVRADEGTTQEICVAHGTTLEALALVITDMYGAAIDACDGPYQADNQAYLSRERQAFLTMLAWQTLCLPGRYVLRPVEPIFEQCTLVITDGAGGFFAP